MDVRQLYRRAKGSFESVLACGAAKMDALERCVFVRGAAFVLALALVGVVMFLLNLYTPMLMDDYDYLYSWATGERVKSIGDALRSQLVHYRITNGRLLTHLFVQSSLLLEKGAFAVVNAAMFLVLLLEIYFLAKPKGGRFEWMLLLAEALALMTMVPFFGMVFLWQTGSCNYLWGTVIALLPAVLLRAVREYGWLCGRGAVCAFFPLVGFIAGWTNENTACGMIALVFAALVLDALEEKPLHGRLWAMWAGQCIGALCMLLAPGNSARAGEFQSAPILIELARRFVNVTIYGMSYLGVLFALVMLLSFLLKGKGARIGYAMLLMFGALGAGYAMIGSPVLSDRTFTGVFALVLTAVMVLFGDLLERIEHVGAAKLAALPVLLVFLVYTGYHGVKDVRAFEAEQAALITTITQAAQRGETSVQVEPVKAHSRFTMNMLIGEEADDWPNFTLEKHFGIAVEGQ